MYQALFFLTVDLKEKKSFRLEDFFFFGFVLNDLALNLYSLKDHQLLEKPKCEILYLNIETVVGPFSLGPFTPNVLLNL